MNGPLAALAALLAVAGSGAERVARLPGVPTGIASVDERTWVVSCIDPPGAFIIDRRDWSVEEYPDSLVEPQGVAVFDGRPVICDRGADLVLVGLPGHTIGHPLQGGPFAAVETRWAGEAGVAIAAVTRDAGGVFLVGQGAAVLLASLPGARGIASADVDLDGDEDLLVACCGSGLHLVANTPEGPIESLIGVIGDGVKAVAVTDMDDDGYPDAIGIACAQGGACLFLNPGSSGEAWERIVLDRAVPGPKAVSVSRGRVLVAAMLGASMLYTPGGSHSLPAGCPSCAWCGDEVYALGHRAGFFMEFRTGRAP